MKHKHQLLRRAVDILDTTLWEHQAWEAEVRKQLEEFEILSDDYTLKLIMRYAYPGEESLTEASKQVQELYERNPEAYDALLEEVLEYVVYLQKSQDKLNETDYGWQRTI